MRRVLVVLFASVLFVVCWTAEAKASTWTLELMGGVAKSLPMPLSISQSGQSDIDFTARYDGESFKIPPYYEYRIGYWKEGKAIEVEFIHHKLYLENNPPEVQLFSISHGLNLIMVNRAWDMESYILRVGGGIVVTHPESTVRGLSFKETGGWNGYYISGATVQGAIAKRFNLWEGLFANIEAKATLSYVVVPIADGDARVTDVSLHGLFGLGYEF